MRTLTTPLAIKAKAVCFLITGLLASALLILDRPTLRTAALLAIAIWSFCRLYYFAFYVLERYLPPSARASGLLSLLHHLTTRSGS